MSDVPRLMMTDVHKRFGATVALAGVDLSIHAGQVHALVGENGAGKSTLMKVLSGAILADAGEMKLEGKFYQPTGPLDARRAGVAMIYQELALCPHLSVTENILLGMERTAGGFVLRKQMRTTAREALQLLGHSNIDPDSPVGSLSIASQQIVEIARAVAVGCRVLVLDEPTSSLTRTDVQNLFKLIDRLRSQGKAIVYISHFLEEVQQVADHITVLRDGKSVDSGPKDAFPNERIVSSMVGRDVSDMYPRSKRTAGDSVLCVDELSGVKLPINASLELHRGEVLGIAGLVGAGRTELLRTIFGLDVVRSGSIRVGAFSGTASPARRLAQGVGLLSENRKEEGLALNLSIADNLTLSKLTGLGPAGLVTPGKQATFAGKWLDRLAVRYRSAQQPIGDLSGGNQQKVAIARLLHHDVDVLLLDEPTRGIDVGSKAAIYELIDQLALGDASAGRPPKAVLMVSSYLPELLGVCDRIAVMHRGTLSETRPVSEWDEQSLMHSATGQEQAA